MNSKISDKDKKDWENFLSSEENLPDKDVILKKKSSKIRTFDLHGYSLDEANKKVRAIILSCVKEKYKEILLITGKGLHSTTDNDAYVSKDLSKLKFSVPEFINNNNELGVHVLSVCEANIKDGGSGAILVKLKNL